MFNKNLLIMVENFISCYVFRGHWLMSRQALKTEFMYLCTALLGNCDVSDLKLASQGLSSTYLISFGRLNDISESGHLFPWPVRVDWENQDESVGWGETDCHHAGELVNVTTGHVLDVKPYRPTTHSFKLTCWKKPTDLTDRQITKHLMFHLWSEAS